MQAALLLLQRNFTSNSVSSTRNVQYLPPSYPYHGPACHSWISLDASDTTHWYPGKIKNSSNGPIIAEPIVYSFQVPPWRPAGIHWLCIPPHHLPCLFAHFDFNKVLRTLRQIPCLGFIPQNNPCPGITPSVLPPVSSRFSPGSWTIRLARHAHIMSLKTALLLAYLTPTRLNSPHVASVSLHLL